MPTVLQMRDRLGVSLATLNSVLSELESQQVVRRLHGVGIYVASDIQKYRVWLICDPSFFRTTGTSLFWGLLIEESRRRAEMGKGVFSLHFALDATEGRAGGKRTPDLNSTSFYLADSIIGDISNGRVDGVLGIGLPLATARWIERHDIPYLALGGPGPYRVLTDAEQIARLGLKVLCDAGCQRIGFWSAVPPYRYTQPGIPSEGAKLFAGILAESGRLFESDLVWDNQHLIPEGGGLHTLSHQEQGYHAAMEAFGPHTDRADWPDGILSTDDMLTQGLLTALQRLGVRVGEELSVASHANVGSLALLGWEDRVTRLEIDPAEMVSALFDNIESRMRGDASVKSETLIQPRLRLAGEVL